jgi:hypothetical protein
LRFSPHNLVLVAMKFHVPHEESLRRGRGDPSWHVLSDIALRTTAISVIRYDDDIRPGDAHTTASR